ncbi:MAG TPA: site-specific DNA-methyltransferase [Clostridiales bacterium]|nr:site-specific DNA-methyltransferase [Clostridiales bacterium]
MKSGRNKTIDFDLTEGEKYLKRVVYEKDVKSLPVNSVVCGDAFKSLEKVENACVDLLIVDPPYNLFKNYHGNSFKKTSDEEYAAYTEKWIKAVKPKLKPTASVYVCCDWKSSITIGRVLAENFELKNRITWQREKGRGASRNWKNGLEDVYFCTAGDEYIFNLAAVKQRKKVLAPYKENGSPKDWVETPCGRYRDTCPSNFWDDISVPYWSMAENTAHPTQKPEKLIAKIILASSNEGDLILDPFAGSGTSAVTAKKLGRNYVAIEQNPLYCAWAIKRLETAETDKSIQGYFDGVFWERNSRPQSDN